VYFSFISSIFKSRASLQLENIILRKQIDILMRKQKRPLVHNRDRLFFVLISKLYTDWKKAFLLFQPDTLIRWHKQGFKLFWRMKTKNNGGRNRIDPELKSLIVQIARENPLWGASRIHGELLKLGFDISQATVSTYKPKIIKSSWMKSKHSKKGISNYLTVVFNLLSI